MILYLSWMFHLINRTMYTYTRWQVNPGTFKYTLVVVLARNLLSNTIMFCPPRYHHFDPLFLRLSIFSLSLPLFSSLSLPLFSLSLSSLLFSLSLFSLSLFSRSSLSSAPQHSPFQTANWTVIDSRYEDFFVLEGDLFNGTSRHVTLA